MSALFDDRPVLVRQSEATRSVWGDAESGQVVDRFYGEGPRISGVSYTVAAGEWFGSSDAFRPVPLVEEERCQFVVSGTFALHDPESGNLAVAGPGEAITWRGDQFHFGYNVGAGETVLLDFFTPQGRPPGTSDQEWADSKRRVRQVRGGRHDLLGSWPASRPILDEAGRAGAPTTVTVASALRLLEGTERPTLVSILSSTAGLTVGTLAVHGGPTDDLMHPGDKVVYALDGPVVVTLPASGDLFELQPMDCLFLPGSTAHSFSTVPGASSRVVFGVAPDYR